MSAVGREGGEISPLFGLVDDRPCELGWYRLECRIMRDGYDEDVSSAGYFWHIRVVCALVCGDDLPFRERHIALGANGHNEVLPVRTHGIRDLGLTERGRRLR